MTTTDLTPMRLALRPDAYWAATPDGVCFLTHRGPVFFTGRSIHHLIERLAPYLDGRHTLAELTADLSEQRRDQVSRLVGALLERDVLRMLTPRDPAIDEDPGDYRWECGFVGYFRESGAEAFNAYRHSTALVIADGDLLTAVAGACLRSGLRRVVVAGADDRGPGLARLAERTRRDPRQRLLLHHLDLESEAAIRGLLGGGVADLRIVVHATRSLRRARWLDRLCAGRDIHLAQALWCGERVWIGPIGPVSPAGPSWTSGWRRLAGRRPDAAHPAPDEAVAGPATGPALAAVANQLVHGLLRSVTGLAGGWPGRMTAVDAETLHSTTHPVLPHPFTMPAGAAPAERFLEAVAALRDGPRLGEDTFSQRAAWCADDHTGVFGQPAEGDLVQLPLHVCRIEVSDPVGLCSSSRPVPAVTGAGLDFATARLRAALRAFAGYASLMVDPRRLVDHCGNALVGPGDDPDRALRSLRAGRLAGYLWGYRLADQEPHLVDATAVFPALLGRTWPPSTFVVAAYSWRDAVEAALLAHCRRLTLAEQSAATMPFPRLDPHQVPLDGPGRRYLSILAAIDGTTVAYDITGALGVPTVLCCRDGAPAGCASGRTVAEALGQALLETVLRYQATRSGQLAYAPPAVPVSPRRSRGDTVRSATADPPHDLGTIGAALAGRGHLPVVVPLDHDPEVAAVMPYITTVVLVDAG